jgi:hypothetical protein
MSEPIRDGVTVHQEQVAAAAQAVEAAQRAAEAQQQAAGAWLDGGVPAGKVVDAERFRH